MRYAARAMRKMVRAAMIVYCETLASPRAMLVLVALGTLMIVIAVQSSYGACGASLTHKLLSSRD